MPWLYFAFKKLAPVLLIMALIWLNFEAGARHVQRQWDAREAELKAQSNQLLLAAHDKNAKIEHQLSQYATIIGETYDAHQKTINDLAEHNRQLLDQRLQLDRASRRCGALSSPAESAGGGNEASTGTGSFLESAGAGLVAAGAEADAISESLRACQSYVNAIQQQFGG